MQKHQEIIEAPSCYCKMRDDFQILPKMYISEMINIYVISL